MNSPRQALTALASQRARPALGPSSEFSGTYTQSPAFSSSLVEAYQAAQQYLARFRRTSSASNMAALGSWGSTLGADGQAKKLAAAHAKLGTSFKGNNDDDEGEEVVNDNGQSSVETATTYRQKIVFQSTT